MSDEQLVELFTDGACRGNPGPGGWGVLLKWGETTRELCGGAPETTNNRMELTAVLEGLRVLKRTVRVRVHTDSKYVMDGISKWIHGWKKNGWKTSAKQPVKNVDLWQLLDEERLKHEVEWRWVKGHAGHEGNERADQLANQGIDQLRK